MEIVVPYAFTPRSYQIEYFRAKQRFKIAVYHRRSGKTAMALNAQIQKAATRKSVYYYILPTYGQAKRVIWDVLVRKHVPMELVDKLNESELTIYYKNGSIQHFVGAENYNNLRGIGPDDVVLDEFAEMNEKVWTTIIQPILRQNNGTATFIFTPKGRNHAWQLMQAMKDNPEWWISVKTAKDTNAITPEELEEARRTTPKAFFEQEYMCSFIEGAGQFFAGMEDCIGDGILKFDDARFYQVGLDLGKYQDWTVLTPIDRHTFKMGNPLRFNQTTWDYQKDKIKAYMGQIRQHQLVMDATGLGDPIYDDLHTVQGMNITPFKFTESSREALLKNFAIKIQNKEVILPNDQTFLDEMRSMQYVLGQNGKVKMMVPNGVHDDCIMSGALAVWDLLGKVPEPPTETKRMFDREFADDPYGEWTPSRFHYEDVREE
jgi:hypothetical protein